MKKLLILGAISVVLSGLAFFTVYSTEETETPVIQPDISSEVVEVDINPKDLLKATNNYRVSKDRQPLTYNKLLEKSATAKCKDMVKKNYWEHNAPDGSEPWVFVSNTGYNYYKAGENLATGYLTSQGVTSGWISSPKHNKNLLDKEYKDVGFGICESDSSFIEGATTLVVQHLATNTDK